MTGENGEGPLGPDENGVLVSGEAMWFESA